MKIIFLDIDWVMVKFPNSNTKSRAEKVTNINQYVFDNNLINNLKKVLEKTNARIVISSSWRHNMERVRDAFYDANLDWNLVIWKTPDNLWYWRWNEILSYINDWHKNNIYSITHWVVLDDDDFDLKCISRLWKLIKTNPEVWFIEVEKAIELLNN